MGNEGAVCQSEIEDAASEVFMRSSKVDDSVYHSWLAEEFRKRSISHRTSPEWDLNPTGNFYGANLDEDGRIVFEPMDGVEPVYTFLVGGELHIEVMSKVSITEQDKRDLRDYIESSEDWLYTPDDLSKGLIINFPSEGDEPEFYWYDEAGEFHLAKNQEKGFELGGLRFLKDQVLSYFQFFTLTSVIEVLS